MQSLLRLYSFNNKSFHPTPAFIRKMTFSHFCFFLISLTKVFANISLFHSIPVGLSDTSFCNDFIITVDASWDGDKCQTELQMKKSTKYFTHTNAHHYLVLYAQLFNAIWHFIHLRLLTVFFFTIEAPSADSNFSLFKRREDIFISHTRTRRICCQSVI